MILKIFPGELWILAVVLTYLTIIWMPNNLVTRALMGLFMLLPAELFKTTRLLLPQSGVATVHILVVLGYILAIIGMYGMFYPWRIEKVLKKILGKGTNRLRRGMSYRRHRRHNRRFCLGVGVLGEEACRHA